MQLSSYPNQQETTGFTAEMRIANNLFRVVCERSPFFLQKKSFIICHVKFVREELVDEDEKQSVGFTGKIRHRNVDTSSWNEEIRSAEGDSLKEPQKKKNKSC